MGCGRRHGNLARQPAQAPPDGRQAAHLPQEAQVRARPPAGDDEARAERGHQAGARARREHQVPRAAPRQRELLVGIRVRHAQDAPRYVSYNASNNDLVRTQTLVKNAVVQIDAAPFRAWYKRHYGTDILLLTKKGKGLAVEEVKRSKSVQDKLAARNEGHKVEQNNLDQFATGRLYACVSSRPGQSGRCDGYVLEGPELAFYIKKMQKKGRKA